MNEHRSHAMNRIAICRLPRWLRLARFWDSFALWSLGAWDEFQNLFGDRPLEKTTRPERIRPSLEICEPFFFPGSTFGLTSIGALGTGLGLIAREISPAPILAPTPHRPLAQPVQLTDADDPHRPLLGPQTSERAAQVIAPSSVNNIPAAANDDLFSDFFVDPLTGKSLGSPTSRPAGSPAPAIRHAITLDGGNSISAPSGNLGSGSDPSTVLSAPSSSGANGLTSDGLGPRASAPFRTPLAPSSPFAFFSSNQGLASFLASTTQTVQPRAPDWSGSTGWSGTPGSPGTAANGWMWQTTPMVATVGTSSGSLAGSSTSPLGHTPGPLDGP